MADKETESRERQIDLSAFFQDFCFYGADEIRRGLKLDDTDFQMLSRTWGKGGRRLYIYGVLDEIEQVGIALMRSKDMFENSDEIEQGESDPESRRISRNTLTTINDEQSLYVRRLIELLVELINFSQTNSDDYFRHYLVYRELDAVKRLYFAYHRYYACTNHNAEFKMDRLKNIITSLEPSLKLGDCWYLSKQKGGRAPKANGEARLATFDVRFRSGITFSEKIRTHHSGLLL